MIIVADEILDSSNVVAQLLGEKSAFLTKRDIRCLIAQLKCPM